MVATQVTAQFKSQIKLANNSFAKRKFAIVSEVMSIKSKQELENFCEKYLNSNGFNADIVRYECVKECVLSEGVPIRKMYNNKRELIACLYDLVEYHELWFIYKDAYGDIIMLEFR